MVKVSTEKMALDSAELLFEGLEGDVKAVLDLRGLSSRGFTVSSVEDNSSSTTISFDS